MPIVKDVLENLKVKGSVYFCSQLSPPWDIPVSQAPYASFHYVRQGQCTITLESQHHQLEKGDLVFIPHGAPHHLENLSPPLGNLNRSDVTTSLNQHYADNGTRVESTILLCGRFEYARHLSHPLLQQLPQIIILNASDIEKTPWLKGTLQQIASEYQEQEVGCEVVVNRLTEVMLVEILRLMVKIKFATGYIAAMADKQLNIAMTLLHQHPEKEWTLEILAEQSAMSRSSLARKFTQHIGEPMFTYLTRIRMNRAAQLIAAGTLRIDDVAEMAGYQSPLSFNRAFKNFWGQTPFQYKKERKQSSLR